MKGYAVVLLCFAALDGCGSSGGAGGSPAPGSADDLRRLEQSFGPAVASVLPGVPIKNLRCSAATTCQVDLDVRGVIAHVVFDLKRDGRSWSVASITARSPGTRRVYEFPNALWRLRGTA